MNSEENFVDLLMDLDDLYNCFQKRIAHQESRSTIELTIDRLIEILNDIAVKYRVR